jgi:hypothetical protein
VTLKIGHVEVGSPSTWDVDSAGVVEVSGDLIADSLDELLIKRRALLAHDGDRDAPAVPVVWADEPSVDGFYTVERVKVPLSPVDMAVHWASWSATLVPVLGFRRPLVESVLVAKKRENPHVATPYVWHAVPGGADDWRWLSPSSGTTVEATRAVADGTVLWQRTTSAAGYQSAFRWSCAPEGWYAGGCRVELSAGGPFQTVPGRPSLDLGGGWWIGNGLAKFTVTDDGYLGVRWWNPTTALWSATRTFRIRGSDTAEMRFRSIAVVRQSPAAITLRCSGLYVNPNRNGPLDLWVTMRRGSPLLDMRIKTDVSAGFRVGALPTETLSDETTHVTGTETGGFGWAAMTTEDFVIASSVEFRGDPLTLQEWSFGIGGYMTSAVSYLDEDEVMRSFFASGSERVRVGVL